MDGKPLKVPGVKPKAPYLQRSLLLDGLSVVESCTHVTDYKGQMFLTEHLLLFVLQGTYVVRHGKQTYTLGKNQMVLLKKAIVVEYEKSGDPDNDHIFECMMFFLKDSFIKEFIRKFPVPDQRTNEMAPVSVKNVTPMLLGFIQSLAAYFSEPEKIDAGLMKLKMMELLYGIAHTDKILLMQLLQLKQQVRANLPRVLEENFMNPVSLDDLAYLSGRSLSSFKRDFAALYNLSPARWLQIRRLEKANELLSNTQMSVTDVCYATGFENLAHFSKAYKSRYGHSPSRQKAQLS